MTACAWLVFRALLVLLVCQPAMPNDLFPEIRKLAASDPYFRQIQADTAAFHEAAARHGRLPALNLYSYRAGPRDDLLGLAARFGFAPETIPSLNRLETSQIPIAGRILLIPNIPAVFVPEEPASGLERAMASSRSGRMDETRKIVFDWEGRPQRFFFFPGETFNGVERAFFLRIVFRFPVDGGTLSSWYGRRLSPISGQPHLHEGIDIAAPDGSPVFAARDGSVRSVGQDPSLGNYVVLAHANGYNTVYGHLSVVLVKPGAQMSQGTIIGRVGSSGLSTGPHLHFEVRKEGRSLNPGTFLPAARGKT
jgi:murein DD-endopeptidase MepM/ murein hydrolase activator NlpD